MSLFKKIIAGERGSNEEHGMKRLLYVINEPWFFVSHRLELGKAAARSGFEVHVATPDAAGVEAIKSAGFHWHRITLNRSGMKPQDEVRTVFHLYRLYGQVQPDIVHHVTIKPVLYGTLAARLRGIPRVVNAISGMGHLFTHSGWKQHLGKFLYLTFLRHPDMTLIVQNRDDFEAFRCYERRRGSKLCLIPGSGVDTGQFKPNEVRPTTPTIVMTARLLAEKGVREFIQAATIVHRKYPCARFLLAGIMDTANPSAINEIEIKQAEKAGHITWLGHEKNIAGLLDSASIYCLPSYREGLPKSLIEAAAAGLPLISTDVPGCREVVRNEVNGLLVPPKDATALAEAIERLILDPELSCRLGQQARKDALQRFCINKINEAQLELYR